MDVTELYVHKNQQSLRCGYTTGSCAAAAAKAAAILLLTGELPASVRLVTPAGPCLELEVFHPCKTESFAQCAVQKDSGDDPDVTDGILVYAKLEKIPGSEIKVDGGVGVGRVTKPGLSCPVGSAAINPVPRRMIGEAVQEICEQTGYHGGISVEISIPEGVALAEKTYNPRLGIVGGISVLGTSGIVEPMSERALLDSIRLELKMAAESGKQDVLVTPGNYGADFTRDGLRLDAEQAVKCSNYVGDTIDYAVEFGFKRMLLIAHAGKLVKVAAGIMNTHSHVADARAEVLTSHAALHGAPVEAVQRLMDSLTTDEAVKILEEYGLREAVMASVMKKVEDHLRARAGKMEIAALMFSNQYGILGETSTAKEMLRRYEEEYPGNQDV